MLSAIEKNRKVLKYEWPRSLKTPPEFQAKKSFPPNNKFALKIIDEKLILKKNTGFHNLESKILLIIFSHFNEKELLSYICGVCRHWYNVARNPKLWKELEFKEKTDTTTICNLLWKSKNLEKLTLKNMDNPVTVIRQMCRCNRLLKHIKIKNCRNGQNEKIPESVLRNILYSCENLESLDLKNTQFSGARFYHELSNLPNLRKLNLSKSKYLLAKDLVTISLNCHNLEDISITRIEKSLNPFEINDQDVVFFFNNLASTLKRVDFDTTGLTGPSFEAILSCPNLERLSLRHALFLSGEIFSNYLSKLKGLKQLRLTQASQLVSEDFIPLCKKNIFDRLDLVDLSACGRISDLGLQSLIQCCRDRLTYLNLKSCKSINNLNFVIKNCSKLQYLNIAYCSCSDPPHVKNLISKMRKLSKLVVDKRILPCSDLLLLHTCAPNLKLIFSMSEFYKDEAPVF